jgi:hypothetical protein
MDALDHLLAEIGGSAIDRSLEGVEAGVWARIETGHRAAVGNGALLRVQLAVAVATMIIGLAIGSFTVGRASSNQPLPILNYAEVGPWGTLQAGL